VRLEFALLIRRGQAQVQRVQAHSEEFDFQMDGAVGLRPVFGNSTINLGVRFRLTDVYRNKSERAGTIMTLLDTVPDLRAARRPDGLIAFRCTGTLERGPRCNPEGARGAPGGFGGLSAPAAGGFGAVMPPGFAP
jgi:hypothetical protein